MQDISRFIGFNEPFGWLILTQQFTESWQKQWPNNFNSLWSLHNKTVFLQPYFWTHAPSIQLWTSKIFQYYRSLFGSFPHPTYFMCVYIANWWALESSWPLFVWAYGIFWPLKIFRTLMQKSPFWLFFWYFMQDEFYKKWALFWALKK